MIHSFYTDGAVLSNNIIGVLYKKMDIDHIIIMFITIIIKCHNFVLEINSSFHCIGCFFVFVAKLWNNVNASNNL